MNSVSGNFKCFKKCLENRLELLDLARSGDIFWKKIHDTVVVIEIQIDKKGDFKEGVKFTINTGISVDVLRDVVGNVNAVRSFSPPSVEQCQWRQRLGRFFPAQGDIWWSVSDEPSVQSVCSEIATALIDHAFPKIEEMASSEALIRSWQEDRGQGLTEYERRRNLAQLLVILESRDEAEMAIRALEEASLGKSWAISAALQVKKLRAAL